VLSHVAVPSASIVHVEMVATKTTPTELEEGAGLLALGDYLHTKYSLILDLRVSDSDQLHSK